MKNTQKYNYFFSRFWHVTTVYFTNWMLLLNALYYFGVLKRYQESILFVTISVTFLGSVLTYIYPRRVSLRNIDVEIKGYEYQIIDLICHQFPLILLLLFYDPKIKPDNLTLGAVIMLIYVLMFNPLKVYNFDKNLNVKNGTNTKSESKLSKLLVGDKRYYVAVFMILSYFILVIFAIKLNVFK
tara:strand:+ start:63 stop:614 length:552 start_codon:yes stop_codon:yes gene_type:complete